MDDAKTPFDAIVIIGFGGPNGPGDVRPFLENVIRGKSVPRARIDEIAERYLSLFGGVSPITEIMQRQAQRLRQKLHESGIDVPIHLGMRNWHPYLSDMFVDLAREGARRVIAFISAPHHSYPSCGQYKQDVRDARHRLVERGLPDVEVAYVEDWYDHEKFIAANVDQVRAAFCRLEPQMQPRARLLFTAHSIPVAMADQCRYVDQIRTSCQRVVDQLGCKDWVLVFQSRSGRPEEPWLGPDIAEYLRAEQQRGLSAAVLIPIGFTTDHVEVIYELDHRLVEIGREISVAVARAQTVNDHPLFIDMMADVVRRTWNRYAKYPCLPIAADAAS
ncbi:MAG TPA: ferrochelatase [Phycisphaerae bacterium]|nr:ferrochelatase [Phycisphaerae bacterium]HRY67028.1 ferrochelatase [Phycisphaerae bacterium]HSA27725.1 ferrochelatase [Phycisphaerae bacterium]